MTPEAWTMRTAGEILQYLGIPDGRVSEAGLVQARIAGELTSFPSSQDDANIDLAVGVVADALHGTPWEGATSRAEVLADIRSMLRQHFGTVAGLAATPDGSTVATINAGGAPGGAIEVRPVWAEQLLDMVGALLERSQPRGCICPPGAEATCKGLCPRKGVSQ